jgi:integrase/recombinase XerD
MKMDQALKGFLLMRSADGYSKNTVELYRWALELMLDYLKNPEVEDITQKDLLEFFVWLREGYEPKRRNGSTEPLKPRSIENIWTAMRSFFNWATSELSLKTRPDRRIKRPQYDPPEIIPFTQEQVAAMLKACEYVTTKPSDKRRSFTMRRPTASRDVAIILVLLDTGIRVSECSRLRVRDVNLETGEVHIQPYGTGRKTRPRTVMLGKKARKAVWRYLAGREGVADDDYLFVTKQDRRMNRNSIRVLLNQIGDQAGIDKSNPHRFRHTFAIFFLRNGGDVFTLKRILGHSRLEMVERYLDIASSDVKRAHQRASPADNLKI